MQKRELKNDKKTADRRICRKWTKNVRNGRKTATENGTKTENGKKMAILRFPVETIKKRYGNDKKTVRKKTEGKRSGQKREKNGSTKKC